MKWFAPLFRVVSIPGWVWLEQMDVTCLNQFPSVHGQQFHLNEQKKYKQWNDSKEFPINKKTDC